MVFSFDSFADEEVVVTWGEEGSGYFVVGKLVFFMRVTLIPFMGET